MKPEDSIFNQILYQQFNRMCEEQGWAGVPLASLYKQQEKLCLMVEEEEERANHLEKEKKLLLDCVKHYADLNDEVSMYDSRGVSTARATLIQLGILYER